MIRYSAALLSLMLLATSGCAGGHVGLDGASGLYEQAELHYQVDAGRLSEPLAATRVDAQCVSYETVAAGPVAGSATAALRIVYPNPNGPPGSALAEVTLTARNKPAAREVGWGAWMSGLARQAQHSLARSDNPDLLEVWEMDIPRERLDSLLAALTQAGYFQTSASADAAVSLDVSVNRTRSSKAWQSVPELDALMREVRGRGAMVSYHRARHGNLPLIDPESSVAVYQRLQNDDRRWNNELPGDATAIASRSGVAAPPPPDATRLGQLLQPAAPLRQ